MRYSEELKLKVKNELLKQNGKKSHEIAEKFGLPSYIIRQWAVKFNLKFGHYTPFIANKEIKISEELNDIIIGSLLGDGYISIYKKDNSTCTNKNSKLSLRHTIHQKEYLMYKNQLLSKYCKTYLEKPKFNKSIIKDRNVKGFSIRLSTNQNIAFNKYRDEWYPNNKKIIPLSLTKISRLSLAIWFQDDGYISKSGGYYLCTDCFTIEEVEHLCHLLKIQYNLVTSIHLRDKNYNPRIYIHKKSIGDFNNLIIDYMCKSMLYKLHIARNKSDEFRETPEVDNPEPSQS